MSDTFEPLPFVSNSKKDVFEQDPLPTRPEQVEEEECEVEMITQQALQAIKQQAFDEAYQAGLNQAKVEMDEKINHLLTLCDALVHPTQHLTKRLQQELIELSIWLCKQMISAELTIQPQALLAQFDKMYDLLPSAQPLQRLAVNQKGFEILLPLFTSDSRFDEEQLHLDPTLADGEIRLVTNQTTIDSQLERRVESLVQKILLQGKSDE